MAQDYKSTMNLPKTDFSMKAGLPINEPKRLEKWEQMDLYHEVLKQNEGNEPFVLHDGPPYANGPIHIGHAFNKILKDIIVKYKSQRGHYAPYVPGWDCHGQPIEHIIENKLGPEKMKQIDKPTLRRLCREYAEKCVDLQRDGFKRLGVGGEWDDPYLTYAHEYEAGNITLFKQLYETGAIYRGRKPIHWCMHCHTALAEAEIEYGDESSPSIFVRFKMDEVPAQFAAAGLEGECDILIWTTTPWTLPANTAVSLAPEAEYVIIQLDGMNLLMAEALVDSVAEIAGWQGHSIFTADDEPVRVKGIELAELTYTCPIRQDLKGKLIYGNHVTLDTGTGCVHTAPGHGQDDYLVGLEFDIALLMPVDDNGVLTEEAGQFAGLDVWSANPKIIDWLKEQGTLVAHVDISHSYPHCWRCHEPVIFRATDQWFVSMDGTGLRKEATEAIDSVQWYPSWASNRIGAMVADRPDWCISRQRSWGVPIPVFKCRKCGETVANPETFDAVIDLFTNEGADAWYTKDPSEYLPVGTCCPRCGCEEVIPESDILDVWWESGVSHYSVCEQRDYLYRPADMYLEGSDQHRGWFQSSLLTSVGAYHEAPYKSVVSCGFVLDGEGRKMSKSLGNVISPAEVIAKSGADVLRLWTASVDYSQDVSISDEILKGTSDAYRRIRNTFRFLLGNLNDFGNDDLVALDELLPLDRWAIARVQQLLADVTANYEEYRFHAVFRALFDYVVTDLSAIYMDVAKDRLYSAGAKSVERRSAQTALANILEVLVRCFAPILVFTCDEVFENYPEGMKSGIASVHLAGWPELSDFAPQIPADSAAELLADFEQILSVREVVTKALEELRASKVLSKSQEADVTITADAETIELLAKYGEEAIAELCIVSSVSLVADDSASAPTASISKSSLEKCPRCWNYRELIAEGEHAGLCQRCADVVSAIG
ncbi:MAG: isoleucine--tRNA ligase [bacterium]|nr:isoleucine--tRNA ligase [bacterium]